MGEWRQIDQKIEPRKHIDESDECYHVHEFIARGGFDASDANSKISNFKIKPEHKGTNRWYWKEQAVREFAKDLSEQLFEGDVVVFVPSSKTRSHDAYDNRFDLLGTELLRTVAGLAIEEPIVRIKSIVSAHDGGEKLSLQETLATLKWVGFEEIPDRVVIIDDVLTRGTSYKACKKMILDHHPEIEVQGLFWAITVHEED